MVCYCTVVLLACTVLKAQDNLSITTADSTGTTQVKRSGDIDTIVVFSARDSVHFNVRSKRMRLRGSADVKFKEQRLQSEVVIMDFGTSILYSEGVRDSSGRLRGFPLFIDKGEEYAGERIVYNFKTRQGRVTLGETNVEGGFYWGNRIKRVDEKTIYVENGNFTTCDAPHPHFHFNSPRMKVILDDKIFYDPLIMYVEDIPVFAVPFGLYFDMQRGRRSGIILPTPLMTSNNGIVLKGMGYYFAASDYWDTEVLADITSKGGFTLYNNYRYALRDVLTGNLNLRYGYTRPNVTSPYTRNMAVQANHNQILGPQEKITASILFTTSNLYQNTSIDPRERIQQNARSDASYQRTFYNGHTFNMGYSRDQNMINGSVSHAPIITYGIPTFTPITDFPMQVGYRATGRYNYDARRTTDTGAFTINERSVIEHRPSVSVTPKLGYFTFQPSVSYDENWYLQRYTQFVNPDSTIGTTRETGFFREYRMSAGIAASTMLYGMMRPNIGGITAFRHTIQPTLSLTFVPDQSDTSLGFFGSYISPYTGAVERYSRFGSGSIASSQRQLNIGLGLLNQFAIKIAQGDTAPDKPLDILTVRASSSYNLVADSLNLAPISVSLTSPVLNFIQFNSSFTFDIYDQARSINPVTGASTYTTIGKTLMENGKGLARLTSMRMQFGTKFSSEGVSFEKRVNTEDTTAADSTGSKLRARFERRVNYRPEDVDLFGDNSPGWSPVIMPWDAQIDVSYNYNRMTPELSTQSLLVALHGGVSLTESLRLNASTSVDLISGAINFPIIDITKRLHCWLLTVNWVPIGANRGFFLRFAADASILRDLQITKQSTPLYR